MNKVAVAVLVCFVLSVPAASQVYRWRDKDGNLVVSTTPPPPGTASEALKATSPAPSGGGVPNRTGREAPAKRLYDNIKVTMYVTDWCPVCHKARAFLKSLGVNLVEYDVEKDPEREKEWRRKAAGRNGVPLIDIEGIILLGLNPQKIRAALEEKSPS